MPKTRIRERLDKGEILVSDGAWGTFLQKKGLGPGECPELWCIDRAAEVLDVARSYVEAGADMIETDSFGGTRIKLGHYGLGDRAAEINEAAARISREAAGDGVIVIASIGPTGKMVMTGEVTEEELYEAFKEQALALERGGADAACIETMSAEDEAVQAIKAVKENTGLEAICTFTFDRTPAGEYRSMMGLSPADAARAAAGAGADVIGPNCGNGMAGMVDVAREMRAAVPGLPILVQANAGLPERSGGGLVYRETPEMMAALVPDLVKAGANAIGGCCGTTPDHIRAIKRAVASLRR